jgi:ribulose-5-phosphate 4-epimerase/fuculose-1-phosphate aldolase
MADGSLLSVHSLKGKVSDAEWQARVELAALYRLVALHGWDDMIFTHISARVPGPEHHFLINPYGLYFEEMTASALVKIDLDGNVVQETSYKINPAGFTIHSAIHAAREDAQFVMHLHTDQGVAVSAHSEGLLPISQTALLTIRRWPTTTTRAWRCVWTSASGWWPIWATSTSCCCATMARWRWATPAARAGARMFFLERACAMQVLALSAGRHRHPRWPRTRPLRRPATWAAAEWVRWQARLARRAPRRLDRELPGYDA